MKWNNDEMMKWNDDETKFWVFKISGTFICYRGCLNLNCYIGKKVQKNFLMGLKIWRSWGSRIFFSKSPIVGRFSIFHAKLQVFSIRLKRIPIVFDSKEFQFFWIKKEFIFFRIKENSDILTLNPPPPPSPRPTQSPTPPNPQAPFPVWSNTIIT